MLRARPRLILPLLVMLAAGLPAPQPSHAIFHIAFISEVMSGFNGDPEVQFVEVRMDFPGQHLVHDTRLTVFNADGSAATSSDGR